MCGLAVDPRVEFRERIHLGKGHVDFGGAERNAVIGVRIQPLRDALEQPLGARIGRIVGRNLTRVAFGLRKVIAIQRDAREPAFRCGVVPAVQKGRPISVRGAGEIGRREERVTLDRPPWVNWSAGSDTGRNKSQNREQRKPNAKMHERPSTVAANGQ